MAFTLKDDLEDILSCSICLERLTEPKLLPCSHRFCKTCLRHEMERSATSGPSPSFPCPLCKRTAYLPRGRRGNEQADCFETDRLLKAVLERLDGVTEDPSGVCSPHRIRLEIVCYSCRKTGCVRCAWEKHRHCTKLEPFIEMVQRIERELRHQLQETEKNIHEVKSQVGILTLVKKSFENQIQYSNNFIDKCIQEKRDRFNSDHSRLVDSFQSLLLKTSMSKMVGRNIQKIMQTSLAKLEIELKCEKEVLRLKKNNLPFSEHVKRASLQIQSLPDTRKLKRISQNISGTLQLDRREMVFIGEETLADNSAELAGLFGSGDLLGVSSGAFLLDGLITREEQVHLDIEKEEKLLMELLGIMESAEDPRKLLGDLKRFRVSQIANTSDDVGNMTLIVPADSSTASSSRKEPEVNLVRSSSWMVPANYDLPSLPVFFSAFDRDFERMLLSHGPLRSYFYGERILPGPHATYIRPGCNRTVHRCREGTEGLCCLPKDRHLFEKEKKSGNEDLKAITSGNEKTDKIGGIRFAFIVIIIVSAVVLHLIFKD